MAARRDERVGWIIDFTYSHADGRKERVRKVSPVQTRRGAEEHERQLRQELLHPTVQPKEVPTLATWAEEFMLTYARANNRPSERTSKEYAFRVHLLPAFGTRRLCDIGVRDIERFKAERVDALKPKTINNLLQVLAKCLREAKLVGLITDVPTVRKLKVMDQPFDFLSFEEGERLLQAARSRPDWFALVLTALRTGMRFGELSELRWQDVDLVAGRILVRRSVWRGLVGPTKSGKAREIPISPDTANVLRELPSRFVGDLVFVNEAGGRRIHRRAEVMIAKLCRLAGLRHIGWHVLRHTFASQLVMRGRSLKEVQELLGHADIHMTMRYAHLAPGAKRDAILALDAPRLNGDSWQPHGN